MKELALLFGGLAAGAILTAAVVVIWTVRNNPYR